MKKLTLLLIFSLIIAVIPFAVTAENDYDVTTKVSGELVEGEDIYKLSVSLVDIKDETGVAFLEYGIKFDPAVLQLQKADVKVPDIWKEHIDTEMAEDLSRQLNDGEFGWVWVMSQVGYGIKEDGQLALNLEFKVLDSAKTDINVSSLMVTNDNMEEISANSVTLTVDTNKVGSEEINSEASAIKPDYSTPTVSIEPIESETDTVSFDITDDSNIELKPIVPSTSSKADASASDSSADESGNGNTVLIVILSVVGVLAVAACIFVLIRRRSTK